MKFKNKPTNKLTLLLLTAVLVLSQGVGYSQESTLEFYLQESIDYALANNQEVKNARLEQQKADFQVGEILADGLPQVNGNVNLGYNYEIPTVFVPGNAFDPSGDPSQTVAAKFGTNYTGSLGLSLEQMVFDGAYLIGVKAAKTFTQLSEKDHIKTKIDITAAVSKAYFGVLVNRERYKLIERNYTRVDSLLQDTEVMYVNGFAEKIDVNRVKVQYNNLKVELDNYQQIVQLTESLLKFQMGMSTKASISLKDKIEDIGYFDFSVVGNFQHDQRIEYSQMNIRQELNELDIKNIKSRYVPTLDLYASYGRNIGAYNGGDVFSGDWAGVGVIGIKAQVPIFDGLRKRRQVQQRQLNADQILNSFDMLKYNIDLEIEQSLANYNREVQRMQAQKTNMELSREVYDVVKIKYNAGVGSNREVVDADAAYKEAQTNYYNALYDALISKIDLQKAYGVLL
jgi:outer membrane protein TolC